MKITWNEVKNTWYSCGYKLVAAAGLLFAILFLVAGIVLFVVSRYVDGISTFVAAAALSITSLSLFLSAQNAPQAVLCTSEQEINSFLTNFIMMGSPTHIASYRLSWLRSDETMVDLLLTLASQGKIIKVFAAGPRDSLIQRLEDGGIHVKIYPADVDSPPHFTLLNYGKAGQQTMAVARTGLPEHWIDVFRDE
jgi:hypothetical protein